LLLVIAIISLLISILLPALSRARQISQRTVCGSNLRQVGTAFVNYSFDYDGWFPAKPHPSNPNAEVWELAQVQDGAKFSFADPTQGWGPSLSGMIRDIVEKRHTREGLPSPQYLPEPKVMLCPSDRQNNRPNPESSTPGVDPPQWPTATPTYFTDLPKTLTEEANAAKSFISYFYIALWRSDDRGEFIMMADQSNRDDTTTLAFNGLTPEDNHGTRGMNILMVDTHVEWTPARSGSFEDLQEVSQRFWGPIIASRARYGSITNPAITTRNTEVQTIE